MKLWDSLITCLILLSALRVSPLPRGAQRSPQGPVTVRRRGRVVESPLEPPPVQNRMSVHAGGLSQSEVESVDWDERLAPGETCKRPQFGTGARKTYIRSYVCFN